MSRRHRLLSLSYQDDNRKTRLLRWVQHLLPRLGVEDFTASWHDGLALCSLLEEVCPGLCPRPELLKPHHRVNNCRLGMKLAQRYLDVSKVQGVCVCVCVCVCVWWGEGGTVSCSLVNTWNVLRRAHADIYSNTCRSQINCIYIRCKIYEFSFAQSEHMSLGVCVFF